MLSSNVQRNICEYYFGNKYFESRHAKKSFSICRIKVFWHLFIFAVLNRLLGALLLVDGLAVLLGGALALLGVPATGISLLLLFNFFVFVFVFEFHGLCFCLCLRTSSLPTSSHTPSLGSGGTSCLALSCKSCSAPGWQYLKKNLKVRKCLSKLKSQS